MTTKKEIVQQPISDISIMGSGLAGAALAVLLSNRGFRNITVYDKRPRTVEKTTWNRSKSINMSLSFRGIKTLERAGVLPDVLSISIPMRGRMVHSVDGSRNFQPYSPDSTKYLLSISRDQLNEKLRCYAERNAADKVTFLYNQQVKDVNPRTSTFTVKDTVNNVVRTVSTGTMIGCDGAYSAVRQSMSKFPRHEYSQSYMDHGYKELRIPPGPNGQHQLERECLHIWPRGSYMMIALPNMDGSFTCTLFFPFEGDGSSFESLNSPDKIQEFFMNMFPDVVRLMPTLIEDFETNPTCALLTVKTYPWAIDGRAVLVGDSAHAIVPFYGQGMNAAMEDVLELFNNIIEQLPVEQAASSSPVITVEQLSRAYANYQVVRKKNCDAISDMAIENFREMRDYVSNEEFVFKKKLEHFLEQKFPGRYISRYELVSFSHVPYKDTLRIGKLNQQILNSLVKSCGTNYDLNKIDLQQADNLIKLLLN